MPLAGFEVAALALPAAASGLLQLHSFVALSFEDDSCWILDFLPVSPTAPATAAIILSGGTAPGVIRSKRLHSLVKGPRISTRLVGTVLGDPAAITAAVDSFNSTWDLGLRLFSHDCGHYSAGLVQLLTGGGDDNV